MHHALIVVAGVLGSCGGALAQPFLETFDSGIPPTWTLEDYLPGGSVFAWGTNAAVGMGNYTNGEGLCATASSYAMPGPYDVGLLTPWFTVPAEHTLRFRVNYQDALALDFADVDVRAPGGDWVNLVHWDWDLGVAWGGPPYVMAGIDLGFAGFTGGTTAQVRFRYYTESTVPMVHDLYWQVDDFEVLPAPGTAVLAGLGVLTAFRRRR